MGNFIVKRQRGQRISPPEMDPNPNPNRARTVGGISREVESGMDFFEVRPEGYLDMARCALQEFHLRAPEILKNWKSEIPPRDDVLEIGP